MNFHWLFGHKYRLKKLFYRAIVETEYEIEFYKITIFGYYTCSCGETKIEPLDIIDGYMSRERFNEKIEYLNSLGYVDNMEFYGWLAYEASKEQKTENTNTEEKE